MSSQENEFTAFQSEVLLTSTVLVTVGLVLLLFHLPVVAPGLVFYGAGMGIMSIARGTMPFEVFGAPGYAVLMASWLPQARWRKRSRRFWEH